MSEKVLHPLKGTSDVRRRLTREQRYALESLAVEGWDEMSEVEPMEHGAVLVRVYRYDEDGERLVSPRTISRGGITF